MQPTFKLRSRLKVVQAEQKCKFKQEKVAKSLTCAFLSAQFLYKNFVADCKGNPLFCLRSEEIGSIDFFACVADCHRSSSFAYFLKNPNRPWLRSFRWAWGLGGKRARMRW